MVRIILKLINLKIIIFIADVNKVDAVGMTPLMRAVSLSRSKMVRKLLDKGADPYA